MTQLSVSPLSLVLLLMGGARPARHLADRARSWRGACRRRLILAPLAMAAIARSRRVRHAAAADRGPAALLGPVGTGAAGRLVDVARRTLPDDAEAGGGLLVAVIQLAITLGAAGGGLLFDAGGYRATFLASAVLLAGSALLGVLGSRKPSLS